MLIAELVREPWSGRTGTQESSYLCEAWTPLEWQDPTVPSITGRVEVNLTVRNPGRSAAWYAELFGMQTLYDFVAPDGRMHYICLVEPESGLVLCLVGHVGNPGEAFNEVHTGLDHLEFIVERRVDLDEWARRLDDLELLTPASRSRPIPKTRC